MKYVGVVVIVLFVLFSCALPYIEEQAYADALLAIRFLLGDIYNQNLLGLPIGEIDVAANGPGGGTVHIFGTVVNVNGLVNNSLTYNFIDYVTIRANETLTTKFNSMTGDIELTSTYYQPDSHSSAVSGHFDQVISSQDLYVDMTISRDNGTWVINTSGVIYCITSADESDDGEMAGSIAGSIFGYDFSWIF